VLSRPLEPGQYNSAAFASLLKENGIVQSFSRPRQCWDNAAAESWFSTLKNGLIHRHPLHSSLDYRTPVEYEQSLNHQPTQHQAA
jgi:transposase InsO family protein